MRRPFAQDTLQDVSSQRCKTYLLSSDRRIPFLPPDLSSVKKEHIPK